MWCRKYGKDYKVEDFNQIKSIPDDEYLELQAQALFHILATGKCPSCWEDIYIAQNICRDNSIKFGSVACPHCKLPYEIRCKEKVAELVEDDQCLQ
ncbi:MAG: hypothetical protein KAS32_24315 [Candidatus Peribacteraceae bacterium]|nr:hypothetical protein [Candidatus Peribacteraceae bacterium]